MERIDASKTKTHVLRALGDQCFDRCGRVVALTAKRTRTGERGGKDGRTGPLLNALLERLLGLFLFTFEIERARKV